MNVTQRISALVLALAAGIVLAPVMSAHAMTNNMGSVDVTVTQYGGQALANIAVEIVNVETATVVATSTTDTDGTATFAQLPFGLYQLRATAPGYADAVSPLMPLAESMPLSTAALLMQDQDDDCDGDGILNQDDDDDGCDDAAAAAAAAGGFAFLGLSGGGAVGALVGVIAVAGVGIARAAGAFSSDSQ